MEKYDQLRKVIDLMADYETNQNKEGFEPLDFAYWLIDKYSTKPLSGNVAQVNAFENIKHQKPEVQISILVGRMYKYARVYSKKALAGTELSNLDDYSFMATLMFSPCMSKTELTHHNLMDSNTSGADIIKRLLTHGFIEEFDDPNDKRVKRVSLTPMGRQMMFGVFAQMDTVADIIGGNLTETEKANLLGILKKLDAFHHDIYHDCRGESLSFIKNTLKTHNEPNQQ